MNKIPSKLHWACRRGMLELDLILGQFLQQTYPQLSAADQLQFEALLAYPDPLLFDWLIGQSACEHAMQDIVAKIKQNVSKPISN